MHIYGTIETFSILLKLILESRPNRLRKPQSVYRQQVAAFLFWLRPAFYLKLANCAEFDHYRLMVK